MECSDLQDSLLYFSFVGGAGRLVCKQCGHSEKLVGFLHGFGNDWSRTGLQCQNCGRLVTREHANGRDSYENRCGCPEDPTRDNPLFCPNCRSTDVRYGISYIT